MTSFTRRLLFGLPLPFLASERTQASEPPAARPAKLTVWNQTQLYFGTSKPDGTAVTDEQFKLFLDTNVTPRFPEGLTLLTGYGQFKVSSGAIVQERSHVLILFYPPSVRDAEQKIEAIRTDYKSMFGQESVLRADSNAAIGF
jgi:hypothetical protein